MNFVKTRSDVERYGYSLEQTGGGYPSRVLWLTDPQGVRWSYSILGQALYHAESGEPQTESPNYYNDQFMKEEEESRSVLMEMINQLVDLQVEKKLQQKENV